MRWYEMMLFANWWKWAFRTIFMFMLVKTGCRKKHVKRIHPGILFIYSFFSCSYTCSVGLRWHYWWWWVCNAFSLAFTHFPILRNWTQVLSGQHEKVFLHLVASVFRIDVSVNSMIYVVLLLLFFWGKRKILRQTHSTFVRKTKMIDISIIQNPFFSLSISNQTYSNCWIFLQMDGKKKINFQ